MKILMLVNWKVRKCDSVPDSLQPPDYNIEGGDYWFFRHFKEKPEVDVVDISSFKWLEEFEKNKIRFYIWQSVKVLHKLNRYDLIISHGMQSGIVICLFRRLFRTKPKHVVFDIGSFGSASEAGAKLKLMQFASKSIDSLIYHTGTQIDYYSKFFPWLVPKSHFVRYGADLEFYQKQETYGELKEKYLICVGYAKRDWDTLIKAYTKLGTDVALRLIGRADDKYVGIKGVEQLPYIPIDNLKNQIVNSLACILPLESFNYSFGQMTLLQQMALGKCVIAADVPSLRDYIIDGETAIIYEPKNSEDLSDKIRMVLSDSKMRKQIGEKAALWLRNNCNEQTMAEGIEKALQEIL